MIRSPRPDGSRFLLLTVLALSPSLATAHHGQDFLLVESPDVPHPGSVYLIADVTATPSDEAEERATFTPALLFGISPRFAFELHAHTEKPVDQSWGYEATAPAAHVLLIDPDEADGFKLGLSMEYEIAAKADATDDFEVRLSVERGDERSKWAANLIANQEPGGESDLGVAAGYRWGLSPGVALGAELEGSLRHAEGAQLLFAGYFEGDKLGTLKIGLGGERNPAGNFDPIVHAGWVFRLR